MKYEVEKQIQEIDKAIFILELKNIPNMMYIYKYSKE